MTTQRQALGLDSPDDQKIPVRVGDWNALKRAIWRSQVSWDAVVREAVGILERCKHVDGCPGLEDETAPCVGAIRFDSAHPTEVVGCPDREQRMSALVILNAARQSMPTNASKPAGGMYFAPSREYFSEVYSSLAAAQVEIEELKTRLRTLTPEPPAELPPAQQETTQ